MDNNGCKKKCGSLKDRRNLRKKDIVNDALDEVVTIDVEPLEGNEKGQLGIFCACEDPSISVKMRS